MQDHAMAVDTYRKAVDALIAARMHRKSLDERLRVEGQVSDARFECEERHRSDKTDIRARLLSK